MTQLHINLSMSYNHAIMTCTFFSVCISRSLGWFLPFRKNSVIMSPPANDYDHRLYKRWFVTILASSGFMGGGCYLFIILFYYYYLFYHCNIFSDNSALWKCSKRVRPYRQTDRQGEGFSESWPILNYRGLHLTPLTSGVSGMHDSVSNCEWSG